MVFGYAQNYYFHLRKDPIARISGSKMLTCARPPQEQRPLDGRRKQDVER